MRPARFVVLAALALLLAGCRRRPPPPSTQGWKAPPEDPPPATAPAFTWTNEKFQVEGHPQWKLEAIYNRNGALSISLLSGASWPKGTKVVVGAEEKELQGNIVPPISVPSALGDVPIWHGDGDAGSRMPPDKIPIAPSTPMRIRFANGVEIATTLPHGEVSYSVVDHAMRAASTKAFVFDGEGEHKGAHSTFYPSESSEVVGPAEHLRDVDWIAVVEGSTRAVEGKTCSFSGGVKLPMEVTTEKLTLFDRRTHAKIDEKTFEPTEGCPYVAFNRRSVVGPGRETLFGWIKKVQKAKH